MQIIAVLALCNKATGQASWMAAQGYRESHKGLQGSCGAVASQSVGAAQARGGLMPPPQTTTLSEAKLSCTNEFGLLVNAVDKCRPFS